MPVSEIARRSGVSVRTVQRDAARILKSKGRKKWVFHGVAVKAGGKYHHQYPRAAALEYIANRRRFRKGKLPKQTYESDWSDPIPTFPENALVKWISCVGAYAEFPYAGFTALTHLQKKNIYNNLEKWAIIFTETFREFHRIRSRATGETKSEMGRREITEELHRIHLAQIANGLPKRRKLKPWVDYN